MSGIRSAGREAITGFRSKFIKKRLKAIFEISTKIMPEKEIGKVVHYYDKAMVAVVKLNDELVLGDKVKFVHHGSEFEQIVDSMEVDHDKIQSARTGDEIAIKTSQKTHENAKVYRME